MAARAAVRARCARRTVAATAAAAVGNFEATGADAVLSAIILHMVPSLGTSKWATPQSDWPDKRLSSQTSCSEGK